MKKQKQQQKKTLLNAKIISAKSKEVTKIKKKLFIRRRQTNKQKKQLHESYMLHEM